MTHILILKTRFNFWEEKVEESCKEEVNKCIWRTSDVWTIHGKREIILKRRFLIQYFCKIILKSFKRTCSDLIHRHTLTAQKMKFPIDDFFSKCDQICSFLRFGSHLLKKSLRENFIFCAVSHKGLYKTKIGSNFFLTLLSRLTYHDHDSFLANVRILYPLKNSRKPGILRG